MSLIVSYRQCLSARILHGSAGHKHLTSLATALLLTFWCTFTHAGVALLYHHVASDTPAITSITPERFERHLEIIEEEGFSVISLEDMVSHLDNSQAPSTAENNRRVAITFDDAYLSIYETAFPLLRERGWPFTIFVATDFVREADDTYLSWAQLREMSAHGGTIANHTQSHAHLIRQGEKESRAAWRQRVASEITRAGDILADQGFTSRLFAYPYGEYNLELLDIVDDLGLIGFGQQSGAIGAFSRRALLPRYPLAGIYTEEAPFRDKLLSLPMPVEHPEIEPLVGENLRPPLVLNFERAPSSLTLLNCFGPGGVMTIRTEGRTVTVEPVEPVSVGRSRYNCTMAAEDRRFFWFSQLWIRRQDDGSWYPEP